MKYSNTRRVGSNHWSSFRGSSVQIFILCHQDYVLAGSRERGSFNLICAVLQIHRDYFANIFNFILIHFQTAQTRTRIYTFEWMSSEAIVSICLLSGG